MRHQKVHTQQTTLATPVTSPSTSAAAAASDLSQAISPVDRGIGLFNSNAISQQPDTALPQVGDSAGDALGFQDDLQFSDADLNLIWPDSEELFNSLFCSDFTNSWLPAGTLPLPSADADPSGNGVAAAGVFGPDQPPSRGELQAVDGHHAVHGVSEMVSKYSSSLTAAVESKSITSVFLDECLHMFFERWLPTFPIMHRATFVYKDCSHHLLLNAIAIGSLYLGPQDAVGKGEALWRLAHTAVATSWQMLITHRGPLDACPGVQLAVSALLSVVYGALSRNSNIRAASQALHASAFFWARQCGLFECEPYDLSNLPLASAPNQEKMQQWKAWVAREIAQRALMSHYILDGLIAHFRGNATSVRHSSNTLRLSSSEAAWQATTVDDWLVCIRDAPQEPKSFRDIYRQLFVPSDELWVATQRCSSFSLRVLLEGLQSMIADSDPVSGAIINPPTEDQISQALSWTYEKIIACADILDVERLEVLLRWHAVCLEVVTKTPGLCKYICTSRNVEQDLWPGRNVREQDFDLPRFADSANGRKAILHAVAIQEIVEQIPRGRAHVVHMPSSLFAAATIYGAFVFAGKSNTRLLKAVDWRRSVLPVSSLELDLSDTPKFILRNTTNADTATSKNLVYEFNAVHKLFGCLATQWGVSKDMERVVTQWISLCHQ